MTDSFLNERDRRKAIHLLRMIGDHERASAGEVSNAVSQLTKILKPYGFSFDKLIENPEILLGSGHSTDSETAKLHELLKQRNSQVTVLSRENSELRNQNDSLRAENKYLKEELQKLLKEIKAKADAEDRQKILSQRPLLKKALAAIDMEKSALGKILKWPFYAVLGPVGAFIKAKAYGTSLPYQENDSGGSVIRYGAITILSASFWGAAYYADQYAMSKAAEEKAIPLLSLSGCSVNIVNTYKNNISGNATPDNRWQTCEPKHLGTFTSPVFKTKSEPLVLVEFWLRAKNSPNCFESRFHIINPIKAEAAREYNAIKNGIVCK